MVRIGRWILRHGGPLALLAVGVLLWAGVVRLFDLPHYILPGPGRVLAALWRDRALLLRHGSVTFLEMLLGIGLGTTAGVGLATAMFWSPTLRRALLPLLVASQAVPVFAIAPLLVVWFGYGLASKVAMAALIIFFPIAMNTLEGLLSPDPDAVALLVLLDASPWQRFRTVHVPASLPFLLTGLKVGVTVATIGAVIGEWVGSQAGLGFLMLHANAQLKVDRIFAALVLLTAMGVGLYAVVAALERRLLAWRSLEEGSPPHPPRGNP